MELNPLATERSATRPALARLFFGRAGLALAAAAVAAGSLVYLASSTALGTAVAGWLGDLLRRGFGTAGNVTRIQASFAGIGLSLVGGGVALAALRKGWGLLLQRSSNGERLTSIPAVAVHRSDLLVLAFLFAGALLLRLPGIRQSLWLDELGQYEIFIARGPLATLLPRNSLGPQPLMQLIVGLLVWLAGVSELTLRVPLLLAGVVTVPLCYLAVLRIGGSRSAALLAATMLTVNSYHIHYSFQMRTYALTALLGLGALLALVGLLERPTSRRALTLGCLNALLVYSHLYSVYFVAAQALTLSLLAYHDRHEKAAAGEPAAAVRYLWMWSFLVTVAIVAVLYASYAPIILMTRYGPHPDSSYLQHVIRVLTAMPFLVAFDSNGYGSGALLIVLGGMVWRAASRSGHVRLLSWTVIAFIALTVLLPQRGSAFEARYLFCVLPTAVVLGAVGVADWWSASLRGRLIAVGALVAYGLATVAALPRTYQTIQDCRGAVKYVQEHATSPYVTVANSLGKDLLRFYDRSVIPLSSSEELKRLMAGAKEVWAVTAFEEFAGKELFPRDKETQEVILREFQLVTILDGRFPVKVWRHPPRQ